MAGTPGGAGWDPRSIPQFTPALNFRHYGASMPTLAGIVAQDLNVQSLTIGVGLHHTF